MLPIPTATWRGVCPKWIFMFWCCVVLFVGRTQSFPVGGGDSLNDRRALLFFWRRSTPPSPSKSPPKSPDLSSTPQSYGQPRASSPYGVKKVPVPETQTEHTETVTDFASSESHASNPTSQADAAFSFYTSRSTSPSGDGGSKKAPPKQSSPSPPVLPSFASPSVKEAPEASSRPSPSPSRNTTEDASGPKPSSSPEPTDSKKDEGNPSLQEQLSGQIHHSPSSSPSPVQSTTPSPSPSSPSPRSKGMSSDQAALAAEVARDQKAHPKKTTPSPGPSPSPPPQRSMYLSDLPGIGRPTRPSPSIQPEPSISETSPSASPEMAPVESPAATPSASPEVASVESPAATPSASPEVAPVESPEVTPVKSPAVTPSASPEVTPVKSPAATPSASPEVAPIESPEVAPIESPEVTPSASPEVTPRASPEVTPSASPEATPSASPEVTPSASPEVTPSASPEVAPAEGPAVTPSEIPAEIPIETPTTVPSEIPAETPVQSPTTVPIESPATSPSPIPVETLVEIPVTVPSESPAVGSSESPEASFSEIIKAVSSAITEKSPTEVPEATSSEIAEPSIVETPATISSSAEPSAVAVPKSEDLIPESVPLESPDASFISPESIESEALVPSIVPLLPPVEASESSPDSSPIAASSEAPLSSLSVVVASATSPGTSILPETPSSEPDVSPMASIEAPTPSTLPVQPTGITPAQVLDLNPKIRIGVTTKEGKVGVLVPRGVTLKLENVVFEVTDDVDIAIAVEAGTIEFDQVIIRFKPRSVSSFHRTLRSTLSKTQKGLMLTNGAHSKISNSTFEGGTDSMVDVKSVSQFHCFGCVFKDNRGDQGGAIRAESSSVSLEGCSFEKNQALSGGALYILGQHFGDKSTSLTITDSILTDNKATKEGGTLFVKNIDTCLMKHSKVKEGVAGTQGGGLFVSSIRKIQITGSHFDNNKAEASYGGAASLSFCSEIDVSEAHFRSNSANDGGALAVFEKYKASGKLEISNSTFQSNEATDRGGAILIQTKTQGETESSTDAYVTIYDTFFLNNMANDGGAIYAFSNSGESFNLNMGITTTNFSGNHAKKSGGGMYCGRQSIVHFGNSVFQANEAHTGKGCATYCGCSVSKEQTDSLHLQQATEEGGFQPECTTGTASTASAGEPGTSNNKSNTLMYVFITLAVLAALVVVSIAVVLKHKRAMQSNGSNLLQRTLSSFTGPSRLHHIISVPFSDPAESQEDANSTTTALLRRTHEYGEMEHQFDAAVNVEESEIGSVQSHFITDEEERMAETIFADDAFAIDAFGDDPSSPLLPTISNLHQMTDDKRQ